MSTLRKNSQNKSLKTSSNLLPSGRPLGWKLIKLLNLNRVLYENQEDCYHHRPDKVAEISKFLFGQVKAEIWGCR